MFKELGLRGEREECLCEMAMVAVEGRKGVVTEVMEWRKKGEGDEWM